MAESFELIIDSALGSIMLNSSILDHFMSLTNDEDTARFMLHCLSKHEKTSVDIQRESKSAAKATRYIEEANAKFSSKLWDSLLDTYTQAVVHAPSNSCELARAYANRSAVLYEKQMYEDSILDIERALKIGYPDERKTKLYVRKARCLLALGGEKTAREVADALAEAHKWIATMDDAKKKYMNNILREVPINSTTEGISKDDYHKFFPQSFGDNPKIIGASSAIKINYSKKFGRHIIATRDIDAGETLLVHKAYASVIELDFMLKYCWNCSRRAWAGIPCHECVAIIYCSEACRDIAWNDHHSIECSVIPLLLNFNVWNKLMILRLTVKAYKEAGTITKLRDKTAKIDAIRDPIRKNYDGNMFDHTKYAGVYSLFRASRLTIMEALHCMIILYCLGASTEILGERISNFHDLSNNKSAIFIGGLILRHSNVCSINLFGSYTADDPSVSRYAVMMNPLINLFNHSCDPTARSIYAADVTVVVAIEKIEIGAQICISYGPMFWKDSIEQRRGQLELYKFICECRGCVGDSQLMSCLLPSHQFPSATSDIRLMYSLMHLKAFHGITSAMNIRELHSYFMVLSNSINFLQRGTKYPTRELLELKISLIHLFSLIIQKFLLKWR